MTISGTPIPVREVRRVIRRRALLALLLGAVTTFVTPSVDAGERQGAVRTLYASVTDRAGRPVLDMNASEFEVKDGGKAQNITVRLATDPLRVALIVSDRGLGQFQFGALKFCEALIGHGEISITGVVAQPERLNDYSTSADVLRAGLLRLGRRAAGTSDPSAQLIEAILDVAKDIRREGRRPAIVVMRVGGEAPTPVRAVTVQDAIRRSGAVLYAVSVRDSDRVAGYLSELTEERLTILTILGNGSEESGGRFSEVVVNTMGPTMQQIASELINQYRMTYTLPAGVKPSDRVSVSSRRKDVIVHAPTRIAP